MQYDQVKEVLILEDQTELRAARLLWGTVLSQYVTSSLVRELADGGFTEATERLEKANKPNKMVVRLQAARLLVARAQLFDEPCTISSDDEVNKKVIELQNVPL